MRADTASPQVHEPSNSAFYAESLERTATQRTHSVIITCLENSHDSSGVHTVGAR